MQYIEKVRAYSQNMSLSTAVNQAVNECIKEGILSDFLLKNKSEAIAMCIFEFNEERELTLIRRDERELGREEGSTETLYHCITVSTLYDLEHNLSDQEIIHKICAIYGYELDKARTLLQEIKLKQTL